MTLLPTVPFGDKHITRLIVGGNPFRGNSHQSSELSREMQNFFTVARIKQTMFDCQRHGLNTMQLRGDVLIQACVREYWAEGGSMQWIAQTATELANQFSHIEHLASLGVIGIYIHGTNVDNCWHASKMSNIEELLKAVRDSGVQVGLGTHMPEVIDYAEEKGWDIDFYMACMYNLSRQQRESALVSGASANGEVYEESDRLAMLDRIRATRKTCLAFKVLAAGRRCDSSEQIRSIYADTLRAIKPSDAMVVGMFPKHKDQVEENARFVREILNEMNVN